MIDTSIKKKKHKKLTQNCFLKKKKEQKQKPTKINEKIHVQKKIKENRQKQKKKKNQHVGDLEVNSSGIFGNFMSFPLSVFSPFWRENFLVGLERKYLGLTIYFPSSPPN